MKDREKRRLHSVWWGVLAVCVLALGYRVYSVAESQPSLHELERDWAWPVTPVVMPTRGSEAWYFQGVIPDSWEVLGVEGISTNAMICANVPLIDERPGAEKWCNILARRTNPGDELKKGEQKTFYGSMRAAIVGLGRRLVGK